MREKMTPGDLAYLNSRAEVLLGPPQQGSGRKIEGLDTDEPVVVHARQTWSQWLRMWLARLFW